MSVAEDAREEALERYTGDTDVSTGESMDDWGYAECERRAFIAGAKWQSERPTTEAEIEAAAKALYRYDDMDDVDGPWEDECYFRRGEYRGRARAAFEAARKARMQ